MDVAARPAARPDHVGVLEAHHHEPLVEAEHVGRSKVAQGIRVAHQDRLGCRRELVVHLVEAVRRVQRHRALVRGEPPGDVERLPGMIRPLGEAERVLAGIAEARAIQQARTRVHHVHHDETHGTSDGGVGAMALAERVVAAVDLEPLGDRSAHDQDHGRAARAARGPVV